jgi:hypothetical protein
MQLQYSYLDTPPVAVQLALEGHPYFMDLCPSDAELIRQVVNQGIDSHLEAVTESRFDWTAGKLHCEVSAKDLVIILRRLEETGTEAAEDLRSDILQSLDIDEV